MKRKTWIKLIGIVVVAFLINACSTKAKKEIVTLDLSNLDTTVSPGNDFYRFVNGLWMDSTEVPADEGRWGSFNELREDNNKKVLAILDKASANTSYTAESDQRKAADYYAVGMDSVLAEERGITPIVPWMEKIDAISDITQLQQTLEEMHLYGFGGFVGIFVIADLKNSSINSLYLGANGLGLPNRDYYTKDDKKSLEIQEQYVDHIARMLNLANNKEGDFSQQAQAIYTIENQLALASLTPIEERNLQLLYNKMDLNALTEITPSIDWTGYFKDQHIDSADTVIVTQPKYMAAFEKVLSETPLEDIKTYLKWNIINRAAPYLNHELVYTDFEFYSKILHGTTEMKPRWKRVLKNTNASMGEALGKLYVDEVFPPEAKAEAKEMVSYILKAFDERIDNLDWMTDSTKQLAKNKLNKFTVKIGYPDKWKDYSALNIESSGDDYSYFSNILNTSLFVHNEAVEKIGKPVDKTEWHMPPQMVNAYYNPMDNEIVFPAAILQPPFFYPGADPAIQFGGIGAVIGHEATHGFDDMGSNFDADGNMNNWWKDIDKENFNSRTKKLVAQFNAYEPLDEVYVQGELTLGENIADLGGVNLAYDGLQKYLADHEKPGEIEGFTQEQRFFMSWATIWRTKYKDEYLRTQVLTDPHSPGMYRATGPLVNVDAFYNAFDIKATDAMYVPDSLRIKIW